MSTCHNTSETGEDKPEHDGVILEMGVIDENGGRLH